MNKKQKNQLAKLLQKINKMWNRTQWVTKKNVLKKKSNWEEIKKLNTNYLKTKSKIKQNMNRVKINK